MLDRLKIFSYSGRWCPRLLGRFALSRACSWYKYNSILTLAMTKQRHIALWMHYIYIHRPQTFLRESCIMKHHHHNNKYHDHHLVILLHQQHRHQIYDHHHHHRYHRHHPDCEAVVVVIIVVVDVVDGDVVVGGDGGGVGVGVGVVVGVVIAAIVAVADTVVIVALQSTWNVDVLDEVSWVWTSIARRWGLEVFQGMSCDKTLILKHGHTITNHTIHPQFVYSNVKTQVFLINFKSRYTAAHK